MSQITQSGEPSPYLLFEIIPPLRGGSVHQVMEAIEQLIQFEPPFIDVTAH